MRRSVLAMALAGCAVATRPASLDLTAPTTAEDLATVEDLARSSDFAAAPANDLLMPDLLEPPADLGAIPRSWGSPSTAPTNVTLGWNGNYATSYTVTLAADLPGAMLYYTTDGTPPTLASTHATTPLTPIAVAATTRLRWFAATAAGMESAHDDTYGVDSALQSKAGFVIYDVSLDGQGPVATASAGSTISLAVSYRFWYQSSGCGGGLCAAQLVYGADKLDQDCIFDGGAAAFSGSTVTTTTVSLTVPSAPGTHDVQVAQIEDSSCTQAKSMMALKNRPNLVRIGVVLVP